MRSVVKRFGVMLVQFLLFGGVIVALPLSGAGVLLPGWIAIVLIMLGGILTKTAGIYIWQDYHQVGLWKTVFSDRLP